MQTTPRRIWIPEWASAAAPNATIEVASCANSFSTVGILVALQNLVNSTTTPPVISVSYGECEAYMGAAENASFAAAYQQAAAEGISVFASAGDESAASCDAGQYVSFQGVSVSGIASTPYNVAVGGTDFGDSYLKENNTYWGSSNSKSHGSALSYIPESAWNDSCASVLGATFLTGSPVTYGANGFLQHQPRFRILGSRGWQRRSLRVRVWRIGSERLSCGQRNLLGVCQPSWQTGVLGIPADGLRDIPDVSLFAGRWTLVALLHLLLG